jgi:gamma-glutamyltranspeptidase/glutathione hydrolase
MKNGLSLALLLLCLNSTSAAQIQRDPYTTRPVLRGMNYAVSSMKPQATQAAVGILQTGGNAFDAAVAGQAVLGITDAAMNGVGSDAVLLIYDAHSRKVLSINAEGTAPRLATIEWYKQNQNG